MPPEETSKRPTEETLTATAGIGASRSFSDSRDKMNATQELGQGDIVTQEGDEEVTYIYCNTEELPSTSSLASARVRIQDLDRTAPELRLSDGTTLQGEYVDTMGSQLFFMADAQGAYSYYAQSEKMIYFRGPVPRPPGAAGT